MSKKQQEAEERERKTIKKSESITRLLKAATTDIKSALACIDRYKVEDMDFEEGHSWANGAADKLGHALSMIKECRE